MLVRHQNGVERFDVFTNSRQALGDLAPAQTGINQQTGLAGGDKGRVAGTAACENADFDDKKFP
jgi:hypothetical protein